MENGNLLVGIPFFFKTNGISLFDFVFHLFLYRV
jgi:hypothetical protein